MPVPSSPKARHGRLPAHDSKNKAMYDFGGRDALTGTMYDCNTSCPHFHPTLSGRSTLCRVDTRSCLDIAKHIVDTNSAVPKLLYDPNSIGYKASRYWIHRAISGGAPSLSPSSELIQDWHSALTQETMLAVERKYYRILTEYGIKYEPSSAHGSSTGLTEEGVESVGEKRGPKHEDGASGSDDTVTPGDGHGGIDDSGSNVDSNTLIPNNAEHHDLPLMQD